jgi:hypothetical protein
MTKRAVTISKAALAAALKASPSTITGLIQRGLPTLPDGKIDRRAALGWIVEHTSGHGGGWAEGLRGKGGLGDRAARLLQKHSKATNRTPTEAVPQESFPEAQRRKEIALANLRQLEFAKQSGEVVAIADVEEHLGRVIANCRARLLALPNAVAPEVARESDPATVEEIIKRHVRDALSELSRGEWLDGPKSKPDEENSSEQAR